MPVHVGDRGRTESALCPQGSIQVNGNRYDARCAKEPIQANRDVIVVDGNHLGLVVEPIIPGRPLPSLSRAGEEISVSFCKQITLEGRRADAEENRQRADRLVLIRRSGAFLGLLFAIGGLWSVWDDLSVASESVRMIACIIAPLLSIPWGILVCWYLDDSLVRLDKDLRHLTLPATCLALLGTTAGATLGTLAYGLVPGLLLAIVATFLFGIILPGLALINEWI